MSNESTNCHKLLAGYDFYLTSRDKILNLIESASAKWLNDTSRAAAEFSVFSPIAQIPTALAVLKDRKLTRPLTDKAAILLNGLISARERAVGSIQIPVEQTRFLQNFVREFVSKKLVPENTGAFSIIYGRDHFSVFALELDPFLKHRSFKDIRRLTSAEFADFKSLEKDGDQDVAEIFVEDFVSLAFYLEGDSNRSQHADQVLLWIPNWIVIRETAGMPYDPDRNYSVLGEVRD